MKGSYLHQNNRSNNEPNKSKREIRPKKKLICTPKQKNHDEQNKNK